MNHNALRDDIHAQNVAAGWWTNLETGESILETRNRPEMLCLVASELMEGWTDGFGPDSHLPEYPAIFVELADAAIRLLDMAGADDVDLMAHSGVVVFRSLEQNEMLLQIINYVVSDALEGWRKGNMDLYKSSIKQAYHAIWKMADFFFEFDLEEVIAAKVAYNRNRADHKIENRLQEGGKKI